MSTLMAIEANGALSSALQGIRNAGRQYRTGSEEMSSIVNRGTTDTFSNSQEKAVSMSEQLRDSLNSKSTIEQMFPSMTAAGSTYTANLQVVDGLNNMTKSTFSMIV